jgi:ADP-ribose pyrophosphatase YjhB (NUDIX family)
MAFEIKVLEKGDKKGWTAEVRAKLLGLSRVIRDVRFLELKSKFGTLRYGKRPEGYDAWTFEYPGGAVTVPYAFTPENELLVALVREARANIEGGALFNAIGGFVKPNEAVEEAQVRASEAETGLLREAEMLPGPHSVADRAFFVSNPDTGQGCNRVFGMQIPFAELVLAEEGGYAVASLGDFKKADDVRFFPWREAVQRTPDGIARAAIAQLLAAKLPKEGSAI